MASEISICNQGLGWVGGKRITSFDDETTEANLCKDNFSDLRDAVLEDANWTFAMKRVILAPEASAPAYGYSYQFTLPGNCLRVVSVSDSSNPGDENNIEWEKEENMILADTNVLYVKYIHRITEVSKFSALFNQALAARIAADFAIPLAASAKLQDKMQALYEAKLYNATNRDGLQGRNKKIKSDTFIKVR